MSFTLNWRQNQTRYCYLKGGQLAAFQVTTYFKFFFILSTASITFSRWPKTDRRKHPSPLGSKPEPGVPTTLHS